MLVSIDYPMMLRQSPPLDLVESYSLLNCESTSSLEEEDDDDEEEEEEEEEAALIRPPSRRHITLTLALHFHRPQPPGIPFCHVTQSFRQSCADVRTDPNPVIK